MKKYILFLSLAFICQFNLFSQNREKAGPSFIDSTNVVLSGPLSKAKLIPTSKKPKLYNPRNRGINKIVPGKGLPKTGDPVIQKKMGDIPSKSPILSFEGANTLATPSDPTGAVGRNHYMNAWNSEFSIWDKQGNQLVPPTSLASIGGSFEEETDGDPIVFYDEPADRFIMMQFSDDLKPIGDSNTPAALLIAVSQGPDPVNSGWFTYRFDLESLPDYPKISLWSDGYYITTNKDPKAPEENQVVFVLERDKMLAGDNGVKILGFPLPGIENNGFYSPAGFSVMGTELPPPGNSPIMYLQDDDWAGVNQDHLKLWYINTNWTNPINSSIEESQEITNGVSPFTATFDGGNFKNLPQPGNDIKIDALQGALMYMTQYRRFENYNSVVLNFVVDVAAGPVKHAGIRWYELRQTSDGAPWTVYQEGTYAPDGSDRFCGSIGIDKRGNIALGYTVVNDNPVKPVFPSIRYTGRYEGDPLGVMTIEEQSIVKGESPQPSSSGRYGDYAHLSIDPVDDLTFWHNAEYFDGARRLNKVGVFRFSATEENDIGVIALVSPKDASLTSSEKIVVKLRNYGLNAQSNFGISYSINGGPKVTEVFTETIAAETTAEFTFNQTADLSEEGQIYAINITTELNSDQNPGNNGITEEVKNLPPNDVGVTSIAAPETRENLSASEKVSILIENFGGEEQTNIPVSYQLGNNSVVKETFNGILEVGGSVTYTFNKPVNLSASGRYTIKARTLLPEDFDPSNDSQTASIANLNCIPEGSDCSQGDGIFYFELEGYLNERIPCTSGYLDFIGGTVDLDRSKGPFTITVQTNFAENNVEKLSMWIDLNDNAVFEDSERFITSEVIPEENKSFSYDFELPSNANLGQHLLRVRAGDTSFSGDLNDPCSVMAYGTTHDYSINIVDSTLDLNDFILNEAELKIVTDPTKENTFRILLETEFSEPLRISVYTILGQQLLENQIQNDGDGYFYVLDMSYAAPGVYLLRVGTRKVGKVQRFLVK